MRPHEARALCLDGDVGSACRRLRRMGMDAAALRDLLGRRDDSGWTSWSGNVEVDDGHGGLAQVAVRVPAPGRHPRLGALILLHGAGGSGEEVLPGFAALGDALSMAIICPTARHRSQGASARDFAGIFGRRFQRPHWDLSGQDSPLAALRWARAALEVDPDRCVVAGVSMGGIATWNLAMRFWQSFAAAVPINGALSAWELFGTDARTRALLPNVLPLPVFAVHGGRDRQIPPDFDRGSFATLREDGHKDIEYVEVPDGEHPLPTLGLDEGSPLLERLAAWLGDRRRRCRPVEINHRAIDDRHGRAHWVRVGGVRPGEVARVHARQVEPDRMDIEVSGADRVTLYASGDRLAPGDAVTVLVNGAATSVRFEPDLATVVETYREEADPALAAEQVIRLDVPRSAVPFPNDSGRRHSHADEN
ncbi:alpha/beta hydrolase family protein [Actinomadura oligospora]|uniref:alpha/beta hydrolase family protein n=1 Tax=Actinomadura oligospora TaxID=111804 RepID=UPI0004AC750C|nr:alpha/beta hydrolase [Actinomadura oligospora]